MTSLVEISSTLHMPVEEMVTIGERQIRNPASEVYKSVKTDIGKKIAAVKAVAENDAKTRTRARVYVHHTVTPSQRYTLSAAFPHWDLKFNGTQLRSASMARAVASLMGEYLLDKVKARRGTVLAFDTGIQTNLLRSRHWVHVCVPAYNMESQYEFYMEDRALCAIVNAHYSKGQKPGLAQRYVEGEARIHCGNPTACMEQASAAAMMLHRTDTNLRQIAFYMLQHGVKLLYFAVQGNKHMEMCTQGKFPELDAYVQPTEQGTRIDLVHQNDSSMNTSRLYSNYLELVARTEVVLNGMTFRKELDNQMLGYLVYKVTCFDAAGLVSEVPAYRSWMDPTYRDCYMVYAPVLCPHGTVSKASDWSMTSFPVRRELIDDVHDAAMRATGVKDLEGTIQRRLNSKTSNQVVLNQIVQRNSLLAVTRFDLVVLVIYASVFMLRFKDGQAVTALAPHAREMAQLGKQGAIGMLSTYLATRVRNATDALSTYAAAVRGLYYSISTSDDLPLPSFALEPGFTLYSDSGSSNPRFRGWRTPGQDPVHGFNTKLPGDRYKAILPYADVSSDFKDAQSDTELEPLDPWLIATGEAYCDPSETAMTKKVKSGDHVMRFSEPPESMWQYAGRTAQTLGQYFSSTWSSHKQPDVMGGGLYSPQTRMAPELEHDVRMEDRFQSYAPEVTEIVNKVLNDNSNLAAFNHEYVSTQVFGAGQPPEVVPGSFSDDPVSDIRDALNKIFPGSLLMNTQFFESDKHYGDMEHNLKVVKVKVDLSKFLPLKPEAFYLPVLRGHVLPDAKNNTTNVLRTMEKRNANTPDNTFPMDEKRLLETAWDHYLKVYCKPGTAEILESLPYIGPDERVVREWVSRLDEAKRKKLANQEGFGLEDIDLSSNALMLKGKIKPTLDGSYASALKMPQSIQYDSSGKSTATLSPVIGHKVERELSVLKSNVLVLQRKGVKEINEFLNGFDWRPNEKGERYYLEGDYAQYDKSQGIVAGKLHWMKCARFGVLPEITQFVHQHNLTRSISAVEAGVKMFIDHQRGSGHPDTLDGNNDVNELVMAELLYNIMDKIEFIILMGDDFIVAVRGIVDLTSWEAEVARRYNLTIKLSLQRHGYICSYDIVHYPGGETRVVADVIKRALSFLSVSVKHEELFNERFISFYDNMQGIDDVRVQQYLASAVPERVRVYLPNIDAEAMLLLCKACATLRTDFGKFRAMFAAQDTLRTY